MSDTRGPADRSLLLFRKIEEADRRASARRLLDAGTGGIDADDDLWELRDVVEADGAPVAVAATCPLGPGRVRLTAVVVTVPHRGHGIGQRMVDDLVDALRARGVLVLVTAMPVHDRDQVWFDVAL